MDAVGANFSNQPFTTFFAAVTGFISLYFTARLLRFYRQNGQGSRLVNLEQKLGERVFRKPAEFLKPPTPNSTASAATSSVIEEKSLSKQESGSGTGARTVKPAFSSGSENKFLQDYIRLAQNGGG